MGGKVAQKKMAKKQRLESTITIGAALQASLRGNIGFVQSGLKKVGDGIKTVSKRQAALGKQRKVLEREGRSVDQLDREYAQLGQTLERLKHKQQKWNAAAAAGSKVGGKFSAMTGQIGRLARNTSVAVGGAAVGIFGLVNSTATLGDKVAKTADKIGLTTTALQELRYGAERSGLSTQKLDSSMERFVKRLGEGALGKGEARAAYDELGLSAEALSKMAPEQALAAVAEQMKTVEGQSKKVALAAMMFGREGTDMVNMLKDGSAGLDQFSKDAVATGYVLSEEAARDAEKFKDALLDTQLGMAGLKNTIGSALMPIVTDMMKDMSGWMRENRGLVIDFSKRFAEGFRDAVPVIGQAISGLTKAATVIGGVIGSVATLVGGFDNLGIIVGSLFAAKAVLSIVNFGSAVWGLGSAMLGLVGGMPAVVVGIKAIGLAMMANPIGLAIAGIALAAGLVITYWEPIKSFFGDLWGEVGGYFTTAWDLAKTIFGWTPLGMVMRTWKPAFDWLSGKVEWIGNAWKSVSSFFGGGEGPAPAPTASTAHAAAVVANAAPAANRKAGGNTTITNANQISITTQPGQDAQEIVDEIERRQRERDNSALYDGAAVYG